MTFRIYMLVMMFFYTLTYYKFPHRSCGEVIHNQDELNKNTIKYLLRNCII